MSKLIWGGARSHTNGSEQTHCASNRNGIALSLLGGVFEGRTFDETQYAEREITLATNIGSHYRPSTHFVRADRVVERKGQAPFLLLTSRTTTHDTLFFSSFRKGYAAEYNGEEHESTLGIVGGALCGDQGGPKLPNVSAGSQVTEGTSTSN